MGYLTAGLRWLFLPACIVALAAVAAPVQAAEEGLTAPYRPGAPTIDGALDDDHWTEAHKVMLTLNGILREDRTRTSDLRLTYNETHLFLALTFTPGGGAHPDDFLLMAFSDGHTRDSLRYGWAHPDLLEDRVWNGSAWARDADMDCTTVATAARSEVDGSWHYEVAKPLVGDPCDVQISPGDTLTVHIEFRENRPAPDHGDNFRWPRGTTTSAPLDWGALRLLSEDDPASSREDSSTRAGSEGGTTAGPDNASAPGGPERDAAESPGLPMLLVCIGVLAPLMRLCRRP